MKSIHDNHLFFLSGPNRRGEATEEGTAEGRGETTEKEPAPANPSDRNEDKGGDQEARGSQSRSRCG